MQNLSTSPDSRQERITRAVAAMRAQLDAAGIPNRHVSDADLYRVMYTVWWLTHLDNRDPDNPDEQARTLRMLRESTEQAGAA